MNKLLILSLFASFQLFAGDLVYKNGFENNALVAGTASGITSTGLVLQLTSAGITETLNVETNGSLVFSSVITVAATWDVSIVTFPTALNCTISNNSGTMTPGGVNDLQIVCANGALIWNKGNWDQLDWH